MHDGAGHAYPRGSAYESEHLLRSKRLCVQETDLPCFLSVPFQRSYTAATVASLHFVDTSVCPSFLMVPYTILMCLMMALALCLASVDLTHNIF